MDTNQSINHLFLIRQNSQYDERERKKDNETEKSNTETHRQALVTQTTDNSNYSVRTIKRQLSKYTLKITCSVH